MGKFEYGLIWSGTVKLRLVLVRYGWVRYGTVMVRSRYGQGTVKVRLVLVRYGWVRYGTVKVRSGTVGYVALRVRYGTTYVKISMRLQYIKKKKTVKRSYKNLKFFWRSFSYFFQNFKILFSRSFWWKKESFEIIYFQNSHQFPSLSYMLYFINVFELGIIKKSTTTTTD